MSYMDQRVSSSSDPQREIEETPQSPLNPRRRVSPYQPLSPNSHVTRRDTRGSPDYDEDYDRPSKRSRAYSISPPRQSDRSMESVIVYFPIPEHCVGLVIGRNGSEIQQISKNSSCRVQVATDRSNNGSRMVEIQGFPQNIETAKAMITEVVNRGTTRQPTSSGNSTQSVRPQPNRRQAKITINIPIPANKCGSVIGKNGETMKKLRAWSNCLINLIQDSNVADKDKPLQITGDYESVEQAKKLVNDILNSSDDTPAASFMAGNGNISTKAVQVKVPRSTVGAIMGLQGKNIRKISDETQTKIQFLPDDDPKLMERTIAIIGNENKVNVAAQLIRDIVEANGIDNNIPISLFYMSVPAAKCGLVIGRGGETIKQINQESGAHCELSREPDQNPLEKTFVIRGSEVQVEHAKHLICQKVGDIPLEVPFDILKFQHQQAMQNPQYQQMMQQQQYQQQQQMQQQQQIQQQQYQQQQMWNAQQQQQSMYQQPQQPMIQQGGMPHSQMIPMQNQPMYQQQIQQPQQTVMADWQQSQARQQQQQPLQHVPTANQNQLIAGAIPAVQQLFQQQKQLQLQQEQAAAAQAAQAAQPAQKPLSAYSQRFGVPGAKATSSAATSSQAATSSEASDGGADFSAQWLEYYISIGDQTGIDTVRARIAEIEEEKRRKAAPKESEYAQRFLNRH